MADRTTLPARDLSPLQTVGRLMACIHCEALVDVIEIPEPWLDAEQYVCGQCLAPVVEAETARDRILNGTYDPRTEAVPF